MPTSFEKTIPTLDGAKVGEHISDGAQAMSNAKIKGSEVINQSIMGAAKEIGTAIGKKQAAKKAQKEKSNNEEAINEEAINEKKRDEVTGQIGDALNLSPNQF